MRLLLYLVTHTNGSFSSGICVYSITVAASILGVVLHAVNHEELLRNRKQTPTIVCVCMYINTLVCRVIPSQCVG